MLLILFMLLFYDKGTAKFLNKQIFYEKFFLFRENLHKDNMFH